jgi:hypothetical protein
VKTGEKSYKTYLWVKIRIFFLGKTTKLILTFANKDRVYQVEQQTVLKSKGRPLAMPANVRIGSNNLV